jgi:hypothetical protein
VGATRQRADARVDGRRRHAAAWDCACCPKATERVGRHAADHPAADAGLASKILSASSHFYEVQVEFPAGVKTDQSVYTTVRTHPTSKTRARLRVRVPEPLDLVRARDQRTDVPPSAAALPMDEIPLSLQPRLDDRATAATVTFLTTGAADPQSVELPAFSACGSLSAP